MAVKSTSCYLLMSGRAECRYVIQQGHRLDNATQMGQEELSLLTHFTHYVIFSFSFFCWNCMMWALALSITFCLFFISYVVVRETGILFKYATALWVSVRGVMYFRKTATLEE